MKNKSKLTPGAKNKVKATLDRLFIFLLFAAILFAGYIHRLGKIDAILLAAVLLVYVIQYEITKKWVSKSLAYTIDVQAGDTSSAAKKIIDFSQKQKEEINGYLSNMETASKSAKVLGETLSETKVNAKNVSAKANQTLDFSQKEQVSVKENIEKMISLKQKIQIIAGLILDLSEHTQQIGDTIYLIDDIAEQTNMLALNAAVEAARAGEHGKGFSIVAGEIRKLADESKQATMKISSLIKSIQQAANSTVMATEEGSKEIEAGVELADNINNNIDALMNIISEVKDDAEKICSESEGQEDFLNTLNSAMASVNDGLNNVLKTLDEKIENVASLDRLSDSFKENIG